MRLLLTGSPGIGKTTVICSVLRRLQGITCAGFYTEEVREEGQRKGFKIYTLDGKEGALASVGGREGSRVGRYTVHVEEFEELALPRINPERTPADLYVIDEIGKMELLSQRFKNSLMALLAGPSNLLATIAKKGPGLIEQIKKRSDVELIEVTKENRNDLPAAIAQRLLASLSQSDPNRGSGRRDLR